MTRLSVRLLAAGMLTLCLAPAAAAQDDDAVLKPAEPDFAIAALPTGLRLPKYKSAFRFTHRFLRPLNEGDFTDLLEDFFGLDNGAQIGLDTASGSSRAARSVCTAPATRRSSSSASTA